MSFIDDLEMVMQVVRDCVDVDGTDNLTRKERTAILRIAHHVDRLQNRQSILNPRAEHFARVPSRLAVDLGCSKKDCRVCGRVPDRSLPNPA